MHPAPSQLTSRIFFSSFTLLLLLPIALLAQKPLLTSSVLPLDPPSIKASLKIPRPELIVVGFAGGFIKRTSSFHGEVALALRLRDQYGANLHSEIFENHHGDDAYRKILSLIDTEHIARRSARVILYGHSWGASEAVDVARELQRSGVPVLLLAEVDGVRKHDHDDSIIPANVVEAINFYQTEGLLHGRPAIEAADPDATKILGNIRLSYKDNDIATPGYPWFARTFTRRHIEIENDPSVWNRIEAMILSNLPPPTQPTQEPSS